MSNNNALRPSTSQPLGDVDPAPSLTPELIMEILLRLPVRSLMRFMCVCKSWKFMISSTHFAKMHLRMSTMNSTLIRHQMLLATPEKVISCSINSVFNISSTPFENVNYPPYYQIIDCCNGLICLLDSPIDQTHALLWNPSTRLKSRKSPLIMHGGILLCHGFGYDYVSDKYKVVVAFVDPIVKNKTVTKVYEFGDSSWRSIQSFSLDESLIYESGIFVGGNSTLNWVMTRVGAVTTNPHVILSLDLGKETFGEVLLPDFGADKPRYVFPTTLKDCICVCYEYKQTHLVLWLMKEYGVKESWIKLMKIPHWELGILELQVLGIAPFVRPFYMSDNDEVLVYNSFVNGVLVYYPKDDRLKLLTIQGEDDARCYPHIYVESLVSPCF